MLTAEGSHTVCQRLGVELLGATLSTRNYSDFPHAGQKPHVYLFPSPQRGGAQPMTGKAVWCACRTAARRAGLHKDLGPHTAQLGW